MQSAFGFKLEAEEHECSRRKLTERADGVEQTSKEMESLNGVSLGSCSSIGGPAGEVSVEMDCIWKEFPEELFPLVLVGLPAQCICRFRSVCKKWNLELHSTNFFERSSPVRSQAPLCLRQTNEGFAVYNPASNFWQCWPYSFVLSNHSSCRSSAFFTSRRSLVPFWERGGAGGLLLLEGYGNDGRALYLANPINKSQKQIPLIPDLQDSCTSFIVGMAMDENTRSFKIVAVQHEIADVDFLLEFLSGFGSAEDEDHVVGMKFYTYDSKCNSWEMTHRFQSGLKQFIKSPTFHNGSLYCLTSVVQAFPKSPPIYQVFCVDEGWVEVQAQMPSPMNFAHLFERQGRLMLVGGMANVEGLTSVHIWQRDAPSEKWVIMKSMPDRLVKALSVPMVLHFRSPFRCDANADCVSVTGISRKLDLCNTVMYSMSRDIWWLLPPCPTSSTPASLFEPRLDVVI